MSGAHARLFFYSNGFILNGAVIARDGDGLKVLAMAESKQLPQQALPTLLQELSQQLGGLPNKAIMLHSRMALGLMDLPVEGAKNLPRDKLDNIVRWEMETLYQDQAPQWNIGNILVQLGIISEQERDDTVQYQQQERHRAASFGGKLLPFGEILIEQGKLESEQLEQSLKMQSQFQEGDSQIAFGWHQAASEGGLFASAMSELERQRWLEAFAENKLHIERFYPAMGALAALLPEEENQCLLELHPTHLVCNVLKKGLFQKIDIVDHHNSSLQLSDVENILQRTDGSLNNLYFWGNYPRTDALLNELDYPVATLAFPDFLLTQPPTRQAPFLMPLLGVARDYFNQNLQYGRIPYVMGMAPPLAWFKQRSTQVGMVVVGIFAALLLTDVYLQQQIGDLSAKIVKINDETRVRSKQAKQRKRDNKRYRVLDDQLMTLEQQLTALQAKKQAIEGNLINRQKFIQQFLPMLVAGMDEHVMLDSVIEESWYRFQVSGLAANQAAIDRFQQNLSRFLPEHGMKLGNTPSNLIKQGEQAGAYRFLLELVADKTAAKKP